MKKTRRLLLFIFFFLGNLLNLSSQKKIPNENQNFKELSDGYYDNIDHREKALEFANTYLKKAKKEFSSDNILHGYYFLASQEKSEIARSYCDSIISLTKRLNINNKYYPYLAFLIKADKFYKERKFKPALDNYLIADSTAQKHQDYDVKKNEIKFQIGLLKIRIGLYQEGLEIFKKLEKTYDKIENKTFSDSLNILLTQFALSDSYIRLHKLDSAQTINSSALRISPKLINNYYEPYFKLYNGIIKFKKGEINESIDLLKKTKNKFIEYGDFPNLAENYFYLGQSFLIKGDKDSGIAYLKKVDSIFLEIGDLHPSLRNTFEQLVSYYSEQKNDSLKLKYLNRLISFDSIISSNYEYLSQGIFKKFDTPTLLLQKEATIERLSKSNKLTFRISIFITFLLSAAIIFSIYLIKKRSLLNMRYQKLIKSLEVDIKPKSISDKDDDVIFGSVVPETITKDLLKKLKSFEKNQDYIKTNITLNSLAKEFKSNTTYLSKTINHHKKCSFSDYLTNLRISYATLVLKNNYHFRKYSIKAIAEETGFKSAETFSKKFHERHGIYPSFYIKKLEKESFDL